MAMTANEFHAQHIIPARLKLQDLENQYREMYRKECGDKIGERARCQNCAYSCVIVTSDHNGCMGGKCTCCNDWCYRWIPENEVSKYLREKHPSDGSLFGRLEDIFGSGFLKKCAAPQKASVVMDLLLTIARFDEKIGAWDSE